MQATALNWNLIYGEVLKDVLVVANFVCVLHVQFDIAVLLRSVQSPFTASSLTWCWSNSLPLPTVCDVLRWTEDTLLGRPYANNDTQEEFYFRDWKNNQWRKRNENYE